MVRVRARVYSRKRLVQSIPFRDLATARNYAGWKRKRGYNVRVVRR